MKRLRKIVSDRPRENRKLVKFNCEISFEVDNGDGEATKYIKLFKNWATQNLKNWDQTILEHFLYSHSIVQDNDDTKYFVEFKITDVLEDDSIQDNNTANTDADNNNVKK